jgi:hypothetical protein
MGPSGLCALVSAVAAVAAWMGRRRRRLGQEQDGQGRHRNLHLRIP